MRRGGPGLPCSANSKSKGPEAEQTGFLGNVFQTHLGVFTVLSFGSLCSPQH